MLHCSMNTDNGQSRLLFAALKDLLDLLELETFVSGSSFHK